MHSCLFYSQQQQPRSGHGSDLINWGETTDDEAMLLEEKRREDQFAQLQVQLIKVHSHQAKVGTKAKKIKRQAKKFKEQVCTPVGCVPPSYCPYLPACTVPGGGCLPLVRGGSGGSASGLGCIYPSMHWGRPPPL